MRGRTLSDAVIILDEAQNTTTHQIKMFLTRLGMNAKMIVTGDMTQIDLPASQTSGLIQAIGILKNVEGIARVEFNKKDIVRHKLVQRIVEAYEKHDEKVRKASMSKKYEQAEKPIAGFCLFSFVDGGISFILGRIRCYIPYLLLGESACREVV